MARYNDDNMHSMRSMLDEMDSIASRIPFDEKEAYLEARRQNPAYANGDSLKTVFLRAEKHNTGLAVHRMCQYFEFKLHWFGKDLLGKSLELSDLRQRDLEILKRGDIQLLKNCADNDGRKIAYYDCCRRETPASDDGSSSITEDAIHFEAVRRATFFFFDVMAVDDEEAQVNGITAVICTDWNKLTGTIPRMSPTGPFGTNDPREQQLKLETVSEMARFLAYAAPLRIVKLHLVYNPESPVLADIAQWLWSMVTRFDEDRVSFCSHQIRSSDQLHSSLRSHGLSVEAVRILSEGGEMTTEGGGLLPFMRNGTNISKQDRPRKIVRGNAGDDIMRGKQEANFSLPSTLFLEDDADYLSPYQCILRQQVEIFEATSDDVQYNASRMNRGIVLGQVGLRCRHCAKSAEWERANGAVYYPGRLDMLYQASQNMAKNHLCSTCNMIPEKDRDLLSFLRTDKRRATSGKDYWSQAASRMGVYEEETDDSKSGRLRYRPAPSSDTFIGGTSASSIVTSSTTTSAASLL